MSGAPFAPDAALAAGGVVLALAAAIAIACTRSLLTIALCAGLFGAALTGAFLALGAPDLAIVEALIGVGVLPLCLVGAVLLTAPAARARGGKLRWGALLAPIAVGAALAAISPGLPGLGAVNPNQGRIYVTRAWGESGVRSGVAAIAGNYRALDTLAELGGLISAALGAYALLGFGERAGQARKQSRGGEAQ